MGKKYSEQVGRGYQEPRGPDRAPASTHLRVGLRYYSSRLILPGRKPSLVWPNLLSFLSQEFGPGQPVLVLDVETALDCLNTGSILEKMSTLP